MSKRVRELVAILAKGMGMGAADIIPGVSGGTIAFITGIYSRLLQAISHFDLKSLSLLGRGKVMDFWQRIDGSFLFPLFVGILISLFTLGRIIAYWLAVYPIQVWSFFFGLILVSALVILRKIKKHTIGIYVLVVLGAILAYYITTATPATTPESGWFLFLSGAIAIIAMILPGISGSFILLLLGKYAFILQKVLVEFNVKVIVLFVLGCIVGLLSFSRLINWLLRRYHDLTIAALSGFMIGSLNKVWPWKIVLESYMDRHGEMKPLIQKNVWPTEFQLVTGEDPYFLQAMLFFAVGMGLVILIEKISVAR